jgi:hypothetical protein
LRSTEVHKSNSSQISSCYVITRVYPGKVLHKNINEIIISRLGLADRIRLWWLKLVSNLTTMMSQDEEVEQQKVEQVMAIMDQDDPLIARRVLRKFNGDVERAILAMLSGDIGQDSSSSWPTDADLKYPPTRPQSRHAGRAGQPSPVIDLTGDNENEGDMETDIQRAVKASLEPLAATFGPSERAADPKWAMVPSNVRFVVSRLLCQFDV